MSGSASPVGGLSSSEVVRRMEAEPNSCAAAEWGCRMCAQIAKAAQDRNDTHAMIKLLDDGICEAVITALNSFCEVSVEVSAYSCLAISTLAQMSRDLKEFLGELGACECVVFALNMHVGNAEVSEFGSAAVGVLAKGDISNSFRLAEAGACDAIVQTGNFGFKLRIEKN